jgi:hypothetical protein
MLRWNVLAGAAVMAVLASIAAPTEADEPATAVQSPPAKAPAPVKTGKERPPVKTGKERLSRKASDEQRVDNCKVQPELRGTTPRPDACERKPETIPTN